MDILRSSSKILGYLKNAELNAKILQIQGKHFDLIKNPRLIDFTLEEKNKIKTHIKNNTLFKEFNDQPKHPLDLNALDSWINNQCTDRFIKAAKSFKNSIRHIGTKEFIRKFKRAAESIKDVYENSVIILGINSKKSNYYFSMLLMSYLYNKYKLLPKDIGSSFNKSFETYTNTVVYIDIDDMMYSGYSDCKIVI